MSDEKILRAFVHETGKSAFAVEIEVSGHVLVGDEPVDAGGGDTGPAPHDLLLAALGECTAMTVRWYALRQKWPLENVEVRLTHRQTQTAGTPGKTDVFTKEIRLIGETLSEEQRQRLRQVAERCPVQRTLEGSPAITTTLAA